MTVPHHIPTTATSTPDTAFATGRVLRALASLLALSMAACDDMDEFGPEAEQDLEADIDDDEPELAADGPAADETVLPGDSSDDEAPAMDGPDALQAPPDDPSALTSSMCCEVVFGDPFTVYVRIPNPGPTFLTDCSNYFAGQHNITYKVKHYYGSPAPYINTTAPIPLGSTRVIPLSYSGSMNAMSCEAWFTT